MTTPDRFVDMVGLVHALEVRETLERGLEGTMGRALGEERARGLVAELAVDGQAEGEG